MAMMMTQEQIDREGERGRRLRESMAEFEDFREPEPDIAATPWPAICPAAIKIAYCGLPLASPKIA